MSQILIGPLVLGLLCVAWFAVQRAWLKCMNQASHRDALERPGYCGTACACRSDCPRRRERAADTANNEES